MEPEHLLTMELKERILGADREIAGLTRLRAEREAQFEAITRELALLDKEIDLLDKTELVLQAISTRVLGQSTKAIDQLVTAGLRSVFFDQNLTFKTALTTFRGKTALRFELYEEGHTVPLTEGYGGGVLAVTGVLLRAITIITLKLRRVMILDETLAHLSEEYHASASALLKRLCKELGFTILLVTHAPTLAASADRHYRAKKKKTGTTFEQLTP